MTDPFLITGSSAQRLITEYEKYGSLTIGFDFDDTVHDYHKRGVSYDLVVQLLRDLKKAGCTLICWTAYPDLNYVKNYLSEHDIPCDGINTDGIPLGWESRKPFFLSFVRRPSRIKTGV